jgi:hypothetical protein
MSDKTITIDGKAYDLDRLSETARKQLNNIRVADRELARLQAQQVLVQTARATYAGVLKAELDKIA